LAVAVSGMSASFDLFNAIRMRRFGRVYTRAFEFGFICPAGVKVTLRVNVPDEHVYFWCYERVDPTIAMGVFQVTCMKDNQWVVPPPGYVVNPHTLDLPYPIPFLVEDFYQAEITNTDVVPRLFRAAAFVADIYRDDYDKFVAEVNFEEEMRALIMKLWSTASEERKLALAAAWPKVT
jgi:hypothetical protein